MFTLKYFLMDLKYAVNICIMFIFISCSNNKIPKFIKYKNQTFIKDDYEVFDLNKNISYKGFSYINKSNDSLFLYEVGNCNIWLLGVLKDNFSVLSLNNGCEKSTTISNFESTTNIRDLNKNKLYIIDFKEGVNILNSNIKKGIVLYVEKKGIINVIKTDSLKFLPTNKTKAILENYLYKLQ